MSLPLPLWAKAALAALLVACVTWGLTAIYGAGADKGRAEVTAVLEAERAAHAAVALKFRQAADLASAESAGRLEATLKAQKEIHDATTVQIQAALDASRLRGVRLSADLARLHDAAARGADPGPAAAAPAAPGDPAGTPEAAADAPSVADLIETANENYAICRRNATRLGELQAWYEALRAPPQNPTE